MLIFSFSSIALARNLMKWNGNDNGRRSRESEIIGRRVIPKVRMKNTVLKEWNVVIRSNHSIPSSASINQWSCLLICECLMVISCGSKNPQDNSKAIKIDRRAYWKGNNLLFVQEWNVRDVRNGLNVTLLVKRQNSLKVATNTRMNASVLEPKTYIFL